VSNLSGSAPSFKSSAPTSYAANSEYSKDLITRGEQMKVMDLLDLDLGGGDNQTVMQHPPPSQQNYPQQRLEIIPDTLAGQLGQLQMDNTNRSYVSPKGIMLTAAAAKGMEIHGTFARRDGEMHLDITVFNKAMQPLTDFAVQFNKNTFGILPAAMLQVRSPLPPGQSADTSLPLMINAITHCEPCVPINQLQIALKNNVGVFFFHTPVPLHILLREDGLMSQSDFLPAYKDDKNDVALGTANGLKFADIAALRQKLSTNNVFCVAERQIEDRYYLYLSSKLMDGSAFMTEMQTQATQGAIISCTIQVKSMINGLADVFKQSLLDIVQSQ
jgi:hypothetical protein